MPKATMWPPETQERTRRALVEMLKLAQECLTPEEIRAEVDAVLGGDHE